MTDIFFKNSFAILENPHPKHSRSWFAWNVWLRVARSGLIGEVDMLDAPGKEFERLTAKCGRNSGKAQPYYPRIYRDSGRSVTESLI